MRFLELKELSRSERLRLIDRKTNFEEAVERVKPIVQDVKQRGDEALRMYTQKFDGVSLEDFKVAEEEFADARKDVDASVADALKKARDNIVEYHERQLKGEWSYEKDGIKLGEIWRPIASAGCYIPGGRAAYPSTALMTIIPAKVAGVERIVCVTPPNSEGKVNPYVLTACEIAGATEVYKVGGSQAIAALAFGTKIIPGVEKIVGPGNIYVTAAKDVVSRFVPIDMPAGPSEVLIIADGHANPDYVALDMIAQAEHDPNAHSILVTTSKEVASKVAEMLNEHIAGKGRGAEALEKNGGVFVVDELEDAVRFSNDYAPEHLELLVEEPRSLLNGISNAGSVFVGEYSPVPLGDYATGTNHVLPTMGYARVFSGLSVGDFMKRISVQEASKEGLKRLAEVVVTLAKAEGLEAHAESIRKRMER
ncbi:MAG: histidinol dehydrogenase [Candidatus Hydrothermarchaeaceae archaeon]